MNPPPRSRRLGAAMLLLVAVCAGGCSFLANEFLPLDVAPAKPEPPSAFAARP